MTDDERDESDGAETVVVLDFLAHGRTEDDRPQYQKEPLAYVIDTETFVDYYNDAQPITLRLHQLNLLPGIGKKLRNDILDERKRKPFETFDELAERIDGLHNPREVLVERILEELQEDDLKYQLFVRDGDG